MEKCKKRELIVSIDESAIFDGELEYRKESLGEHKHLIETIMEKLDLDPDDPEDAKLQALYDAHSYEELAEALKKDKASGIEQHIREYLYRDNDFYVMAWNDSMEMMNEEWKTSPFCGWYKKEDNGEYKYYDSGKKLIAAAVEGHRSNDFEVFRENDGSLTIAGCTYIPVELDYKDMIGKWVIDTCRDDFAIYKLKDFDSFDGEHAQFEVRQYDGNAKKLDVSTIVVDGNGFVKNDHDTYRLMTLRDAIHIKRVLDKRNVLSDLGVI
jgi:hypothetical protein